MEEKIYVVVEQNHDENFTNVWTFKDKHKALVFSRNLIQEYINHWLNIEWNENRICEWDMRCDLEEIQWNTQNWYLNWDWIVDIECVETTLYDNQIQDD